MCKGFLNLYLVVVDFVTVGQKKKKGKEEEDKEEEIFKL